MAIYLDIIIAVTFLVLIVVQSIRPSRSRLSNFELNRRIEQGDESAKQVLDREKLSSKVLALKRMTVGLLLVIITILNILNFELLIGSLLSVFIGVVYSRIADIRFIKKFAGMVYRRSEKSLLKFVRGKKLLFGKGSEPRGLLVSSREELRNLIDMAGEDMLSLDDKKLVLSSLGFGAKKVLSAMTPRSRIISLKKSEYLGPLVLNELHRTGHSRLPVINGDLNHVVGILHLDKLLTLDDKHSTTAEKAMEAKVYYVHEHQTLDQALSTFLSTRHDLFVVVNSAKETVGLLTLQDVIDAIFGRRLIDEFEAHDNLGSVASRNNTD